MKKQICTYIIAMMVISSPVKAQLSSMPLIFSTPIGENTNQVTVSGFYGWGSNEDSGKNKTGNIQISYGLNSLFTLGLGAGTLNPRNAAGNHTLTGQGMVNLSNPAVNGRVRRN